MMELTKVQEEEDGGGQKAKWKLSAGHFSSSIDHGAADEVKKAPHTQWSDHHAS